MGAILSLRGRKAMYRHGEWRSAYPELEASLNRLTKEWIESTGGPPLSSSDPERDTVDEIARQCGAKVLLRAAANPRREFKIHFWRRQMSFPFEG